MKILLSSIACAPFGGSEGFYGWRACRALARLHDVWVMTHGEQRADIQRAREQGMVPENMRFIFAGEARPYSENRMVARLQSWGRYVGFSRESLLYSADYHAKIGFDLVHHVTYTTWRVGCPLWRLGIPLIWGPISGTEKFPLAKFSRMLSPSARMFEWARIVAGIGSRFSPEVRRCARKAFHIFVVHGEALDQLRQLRGNRHGISVLCNLFYNREQIAPNAGRSHARPADAPLKIFAAGNLEGRKGVALALQALALAKREGVRFSYRISSKGPERNHLQRLTAQLDLDREVVFGEPLGRDEYFEELRQSDVYLLPSLREGAGQTMMEAMLAGCVPIVIAAGGPQEIVTDDCGFRIPAGSPEQVARAICAAVVRLWQNPRLPATMGAAAHARIAEHYSEANYLDTINGVYEAAVPGNVQRTSGRL